MALPEHIDPNARTRCPFTGCHALVLAADWRAHDEGHAALERRLKAIEDALEEPAPDPELVDWPGEAEAALATASAPAGPYAPEGPAL